MINTVKTPSRITPSTESLIDVIITNKDIPVLSTAVVDLGFSDHLAQIVKINIGERNRGSKMVVRRQFAHNSTEGFKCLLPKELLTDIYNCLDVNCSLEAILGTFFTMF